MVHPVLEWLLRRMPGLKERAYLARYLVKLDIPPEFMADAKIAELYEQVSACNQTLQYNGITITL